MSSRSAYSQTSRKLVLAFDVGTTFSGISYSVLDPGQMPGIKGVTKFPAQEQITGASKIPTIIYYDRAGNVRAVGAEAMREGIYETAEDENWIKAEWFKLHLRSNEGGKAQFTAEIPPLPLNKTVVQVFADFLRYLFHCAEKYIQETHANGPSLWASVKDSIDFVLSHPNGWEGKEQSQMRRAAVLGGLIPDSPAGQARVSFVTEGEASLHFAIENGILADANLKGQGVVIVDAGGGTIDISSYRRNMENSEKTFEEIAAAQCHFFGSVFVTIAGRKFLKGILAKSPFVDDLDHIIRCFDKTTKLRFRNVDEPQYVKFGSTRDNDPSHGIRFGQLKLLGTDVEKFFEPSVKCIVDSVQVQQRSTRENITHVVLVGGFSASDYLFERVKHALSSLGLTVIRPENHINKAVSDGAVSFYLDHFVRTRDLEHIQRSAKRTSLASGDEAIPDFFIIILPKATQVSEKKEFRRDFCWEVTQMSQLKNVTTQIWCYRGSNPNPRWKDIDTTNYSLLCTIVTDLSHLPLSRVLSFKTGMNYFCAKCEIVLLFGLTELQAQLVWDENGIERRSPAKIVYDTDT